MDGRFLGQAEPAVMADDRPMSMTHALRCTAIQQEVVGRSGSPYTGKLSARPAGKPGDFLQVKGEFATIPSTPPDSATIDKHTELAVCVF